MNGDPFSVPTPAGGQPGQLQRAEVTVINADGTVDVRLTSSRAARNSVPVVAGISPTVGSRVVLAHLDGDPQAPIVLAKL